MSSDRWARSVEYLARAVVAVLVVAGFVLAATTSSAPQCCDAVAYQLEADSIVRGDPDILYVHNYAYAAFLALLQIVGLGGRLEIALVQTALLYLSVLAAAVSISRSTHASVAVAMVPLAAVALIPAAAWNGYTMSEGLAVPVLFVVLALVVAVAFRTMRASTSSDRVTWVLVAALGLASGLAWMARPALAWIPVVAGLLVLGLGAIVAWRSRRLALLFPVVFAAAVGLVALPQLVVGELFQFENARDQQDRGQLYFRYGTDVTGCGSEPLFFSPLEQSYVGPDDALEIAPDNAQWRLTVAVNHIITGWDARPSPTYMDAYADRKWLVVTAFSGFALAAAVTAMAILWRRRRTLLRPRSLVLGSLVLFFLASQAALIMTVTEFRYNVTGWLVAAFCLAVITGLRWWTPTRFAAYVLAALLASTVVLTIGYMTLMFSDQWLRCTGIVP